MTNPWNRISGKILYRDATGKERGREWFSMHTHKQGRAMRAVCEMDEEAIIRDATWNIDAAWRPIGGYVQCVVNDKISGRSWFDINGNAVTCEGRTQDYGRIDQTYTTKAPIQFLGLHPVFADGLIAGVRGRSDPGVEKVITGVTCSYSKNGETQLIALPVDIDVAYVGPETITVGAGKFDAHRYDIRWQKQWEPAHYWVYGDDCVYLKHEWSVSGLKVETIELEMAGAPNQRSR